jgi:sec-independent protein translocase protein TatB
MFNMGIGEVILIMIVALVFLGPEKFPVFAKTILHAYRDLRGYYDEIKRDVVQELNPVKKELSQLSRYKPEDYIESLSLAASTEPKAEETKSGEAGDEASKAEEPKADAAPANTEPRIPEPKEGSPYTD